MSLTGDYPDDARRELELELAKIEARKQMATESPYLFVFWDLTKKALSVTLWGWFWWVMVS